jgi:hypothetical protein
MAYFEIYLFNDQPTTCPKCGNRTDIIFDFYDQPNKAQIHKCMTINCRFQFMIEEN